MRILFTAAVVVLTLMWAINVARTESASGPSPKSVHLNFQVTIPSIVQLQIGSAGGTIDTVHFNVTDFADVQPTIAGDLAPTVKVHTIVAAGQAVNLTANSSTPMNDGAGHNLPFTTISYAGTGDFSAVSGTFNGTAAQSIWSSTGRVNLNGTFAFTYHNSDTYDPGTYNGQVTYTLASP